MCCLNWVHDFSTPLINWGNFGGNNNFTKRYNPVYIGLYRFV